MFIIVFKHINNCYHYLLRVNILLFCINIQFTFVVEFNSLFNMSIYVYFDGERVWCFYVYFRTKRQTDE